MEAGWVAPGAWGLGGLVMVARDLVDLVMVGLEGWDSEEGAEVEEEVEEDLVMAGVAMGAQEAAAKADVAASGWVVAVAEEEAEAEVEAAEGWGVLEAGVKVEEA